MYKRLWKKIQYFRCLDNFPEFNTGSLIVALFCTFLIVIATFTKMQLWQLSVPEDAFINPGDFFARAKSLDDFTKGYLYIPQIPAVLFIAALIGPRIGLLSVALYIIAGLIGFPIFASGGGIHYFAQLAFGYILGYTLGAYLTGNILSAKVTNLSLFRATFVGVISIHLIGIIYSLIITLFTRHSIFVTLGWIWTLSGMQLPYDLLIGFMAVALGRPIRTLLWVAMD